MDLIAAPVNTISLDLSVDDFLASINPYVQSFVPKSDPAWSAMVQPHVAAASAATPEDSLHGGVFDKWQDCWGNTTRLTDRFLLPQTAIAGPPWEWRDKGIVMSRAGGPRARLNALHRVISFLAPTTVLEIGCGDGLNLFALALAMPEIGFSGIELTPAGIRTAKTYQRESSWSPGMRAFAIDPKDPAAISRIDFRLGSARQLPFPDNSFDLVFSCVALEQMEPIRAEVLGELRRVARNWVVLLEPFRDVNADGLRYRYVTAQNYFAMHFHELPEAGFEPCYASSDFPQKLTLGTLLVVARVTPP